MQRKQPAIAILLGLSVTVSACNSTDMLYSQGPWGPAHVRRSYPEYTAPWGRPAIVVEQDVAVIDLPRAQARRYAAFAEVDMPPAPSFGEPRAQLEQPMDAPAISPPSVIPANPPAPAGSQGAAPVQASPPGVFTAPKRASSYAGSWNARIGSSRCKIQLSSVPSLDLYKASTQGCSEGAMRTVNGWSLRDEQVVLFSRGQPVARLSGAEASLSGTMSQSGSALEMTR